MRAVTENGRVRAIERAEMGGSEWRKSWERDLSVTERHSFSAQQLGVLFAKQEEPTAVEYDEFMRSWVDAGVSSEFDRRELVEAEEKTAGGILLPESAKEKPKEGIIISLGEGKTLDDGKKSSFSVAVGDRVLFTSYAGTDVKHDGSEYIIMREDDILAIIG